MERTELESAVEAVLFALGEPVELDRLAEALDATLGQLERACIHLARMYEQEDAGLRLVRLENSWQLTSDPQWGEEVRRLLSRKKPDKLSPAALETLAIVAYFQPVTRAYIDQVRGVDSSHSVGLLMERELIEPCGTMEAPGRPTLFRTTATFLRSFDLESLEDLPPLPEGKEGGEA